MLSLAGKSCLAALALVCAGTAAQAAEQVTLRNGFDLICDHHADDAGKVRLYMDASGSSFLEVSASDIVADQHVDLPAPAATPMTASQKVTTPGPERLTDSDLKPILAKAQKTWDIDADLLASVIRQESGGHVQAVSRAGAQGLMQLMPGTAAELGVENSFAPGQNINGGTAYLDALLKKYKDNLPLALAAYNAGPAAVDRWHGIPPYRETRAYVARVIHEYNRRYLQRQTAKARTSGQVLALAR